MKYIKCICVSSDVKDSNVRLILAHLKKIKDLQYSASWITNSLCVIMLLTVYLILFALFTTKTSTKIEDTEHGWSDVLSSEPVESNWQSFRSFHYPLTNMSFLVWLMDHCEPEDREKWRLWGEWWLLKDHKEPLGDSSVEDYSKAL